MLKRVWLAVMCLLVATPAFATWSVIALDQRTGTVVIASATCVTGEALTRFGGSNPNGLMGIQAIVVPGVGVAAAQAGVDRTRANQMLIYRELRNGTAPAGIIELLSPKSGDGGLLLTATRPGPAATEDNAAGLAVLFEHLAAIGQTVNRLCGPGESATADEPFGNVACSDDQ